MATEYQPQPNAMQARLQNLVEQWSQGRVSLKQIVGLQEAELYAIANQGYYLFLQGKTEPARTLFEGLVAIDPRNPYYYRALGAIYWQMREPERSVRQFTYAIRVAPREITSYINRAEVYVAQKQYRLAEADLRFALNNAQPHEAPLTNKAQAILQMLPSHR